MQFRIGLLQSSVFLICFEKGARCHSRNLRAASLLGKGHLFSHFVMLYLNSFQGFLEKDESLINLLAGC